MIKTDIMKDILHTERQWSLYTHFRGNKVRKADYDYVVVPGAGADRMGMPSAWGCDMADAAAYAYQRGFAEKVICTGGLSPGDKGPYTYAKAGRLYLSRKQRVVPAQDIVELDWSRDTIGDIFEIVDSVRKGKLDGNRFLIIAPDYQAERINIISNHLFGLLSKEMGRDYKVEIVKINNLYLKDNVITKRREKEQQNIIRYQNEWEIYQSLDDFSAALQEKHGAYDKNKTADKNMLGKKLPPDLKPQRRKWVQDQRVGKKYHKRYKGLAA